MNQISLWLKMQKLNIKVKHIFKKLWPLFLKGWKKYKNLVQPLCLVFQYQTHHKKYTIVKILHFYYFNINKKLWPLFLNLWKKKYKKLVQPYRFVLQYQISHKKYKIVKIIKKILINLKKIHWPMCKNKIKTKSRNLWAFIKS